MPDEQSPRWPKLRQPPVPQKVKLRSGTPPRKNPPMEYAIRSDGFWTSATLTPRPEKRLESEEKLCKTFRDRAPLSTPKESGASERTKKRALSREYAAYVSEAAQALLPDVASESCAWKASTGCYKSALFQASVRCRELQRDVGEEMEDGTFVFHGGSEGPELFRLQQACLLLEEICKVSSPLRDTLRFLQREILSCVFENYKPGADVLQLTPFFVLRTHELSQVEVCKQRRLEAEQEIEALQARLDEAKKQAQSLKQQLQKVRQNAQKENESYEMVVSQRNELRQKVEGLRESNAIRFEELRETNAELSSVQAASYLTRKDLDQARKDMTAMNVQLKESNSRVAILSKRVHDLQDAMGLMGEAASPRSGHIPRANVNFELPLELDMELSMATRGRQKKPTDRSTSAVDGRRLLRAVLPQGGCQVVLKGTAEDQMGLQPAAGPAITAAAAAASRREGKEGTPPVMIVSGEAFAALAIGQGLLLPPDPLQYGGQDDEDLVKEVAQEVQVLAEEYGMLLDLYRGLRQDLKRTLRLVPDYNTDELRGTLKSVMVLDNEERVLVPAPVLETEFIGLGDGSNVPPYLRFVGSVSIKPFREEAVTGLCQELWVEKTTHVLLEEDSGRPQLALDMFVNDKFLPARANGRAQQMEVMYNFLLALRDRTTLKQLSEGAHEALGISSVAKPGRRRSNLGRRRSSLNRRPSCQDLGNLGRKMAETCPSCGNVFAADALFCRMCRTKRPGAEDETDQEVCRCGNVFLADAVFCRRCGAERPKSEAALVKSRTQDLLLEEFNPFAELLYRGLLRDLHEDTFHDASTMLLNLCCCLVCLQHRFVSSASRVVGEDEERPLEMNVSVLSAVLRLFFPRKPREHLTALKTILQPTAQLHAVRTRDRLKKERVQFQEETFFTQKHALHKPDAPLPPSISLKEMFCLPAVDGCKMQGGHKQLLDNLLRYPSSFVQELRRQHLLECILSAEKLQRALRVNRKHHAGKDEETAHQLTAKEILEALGKADRDLSLDQRHIYLLRGFGRRLPDMPSTAEDLGEAYVAAGRAQKVRKMLQDYSNELVESGATVVLQDFMQNLHNSGVVKGGKHWEPEITLQNVAEESGITSMLVTAPGRAVLEELTSAHIASGTAREEEGVTRTEPEARAPESPEPFETYRWLAELGHNVQELSLGYSAMYLSYWVNNSL